MSSTFSPSPLAQYALYAASALSAATIPAHTVLGFQEMLPSMRRAAFSVATAGKKEEAGIIAAKIGWWELNQLFGVLAILYAKWAKYGINNNYERSILYLGASYQVLCATAYARKGMYVPLLFLWVAPGLAAVSQVL